MVNVYYIVSSHYKFTSKLALGEGCFIKINNNAGLSVSGILLAALLASMRPFIGSPLNLRVHKLLLLLPETC